MKTPSMLDLMAQYKGKTISDFFIYSFNDAGNKQEATLRAIGLIEELKSLRLQTEFDNFMREEIITRLFDIDFFKEDAKEYPYLFYDYFVLGYGDMMKVPLNDEKIFVIFNSVTYSIVLMMYEDKKLLKFIKNNLKSSLLNRLWGKVSFDGI